MQNKVELFDTTGAVSIEELQTELNTSSKGLTQDESRARLKRYGYNELSEKKEHSLLKFLSYFWGPIPWMIEVAALLSGLIRHWPDFFIIVVLLLANAVIGFWEEFQAGNAISALKAKLALKARVRRDGQWTAIPSRELVPGDVIRIRLGDVVPADARLMGNASVEVDQSALTGESLPVRRTLGQAVFSGSIIRKGEALAMVYATGAESYFGKTARLVQEAETVSHFQGAVLKIGNYLILLAIALVAVILAVALYRGDPITETLQFALVLTVAAIPVALPTVLSVTMAVGARLLSAKETIVSRLVAIEELSGMDILCSDKTGTLTKNELSLGEPFAVEGVTGGEVVESAALCSKAEDRDTIDLAVLKGVEGEAVFEGKLIDHFIPFDPVGKRTQASVEIPGQTSFKVTKGAPQVVLGLSENKDQVREAVETAIDGFARRGFRSLGVAKTDEKGRWRFLGVLPLFDPPRDDSRETIATAKKMGVDIKMITGDQLAIGRETAKQLGMGTHILDTEVFNDSQSMDSQKVSSGQNSGELDRVVESADGFAQVFPEHKFRIVELLQKHGHIVGMTGDGVNDAPALKKADCGIAVSGATDAARAAAAMVLLAPGLSVIIDAIKESRKIFQRMTSYTIYRMAETIRVLLLMTLSILVFNFYPVTAVMIVLLALLNDGAILSIAYDKVHYADKPEAWHMPRILGIATVLGITGVIGSFGIFYIGERLFHLNREFIQSLMYLKLSVAGHLTIFITRTRGPFWSIRPAKILLLAVIGTQLLATLIAVYGIFMAPLGWGWALAVWGYAMVWFLIDDAVKLAAYRIFDAAG